MNNSASLIEIFSSLQGEGMLAGYRQIFIRFPGCNLDCSYCDTEFKLSDSCRVETSPGSGEFKSVPNPFSLDAVIAIISRWCKDNPGAHHSISITGGEPMLHADLLANWLPELNILLPIHLETNGSLPESLPVLIEHIDFISMDIKLPTSAETPQLWDQHRRFLEIAIERDVTVKLIVGDQTSDKDIIKACKLVATVDEEIQTIIQPVTGRDGRVAIKPSQLMHLQAVASRLLDDVRVLPQMHRYLEVA